MRERLGLLDTTDPQELAYAAHLDVVLPVISVWSSHGPSVNKVGWIPDFQHRFLPEFFSPEEVVASFPSAFAYSPPTGDPHAAVAKYRLPAKFAIVANQFWAHKNHMAVVDALALLPSKVPLVIVGQPSDYRDPRNQAVSRLLQRIAERGLSAQVTVLGEVPFADLVGLLRSAAVVIQPSRFEGWSTTVEDAKALGRPLLCSDLAVHREQVPSALGFFDCGDPAALAALLREHWDRLPAGPDGPREARALECEMRFAAEYGAKLLTICRKVSGV